MPNLEVSVPLGGAVDEKEAQRLLRVAINKMAGELRKKGREVAFVSPPVFEWRDKNRSVLWARSAYKYAES